MKGSHRYVLLKYSCDRRKKGKSMNLRNFLSTLVVQIPAVPETKFQDPPLCVLCSVRTGKEEKG